MKTLTLEYNVMGFVPLVFKRELPECWDDLTPRQLLAVSQMFCYNHPDYRFISKLCRIPAVITKKIHPFITFQLLEELSFMHDLSPRNTIIIKQMGDGHAPQSRLEGTDFGQFIFIDTYFQDFSETNNDEHLHKFLAALYTPAGKRFSEKTIKHRTRHFEKVSRHEKQAAIINYGLIREWLQDAYPLIFPRPPKHDDEQKKQTQPKPKARSTGNWLKVFEAMVADDVVNAEKYARLPVHTALRFISKKIKEQRNGKR